MDFGGTVVGGLSGIDYDAANNRYVLVSDHRTPTGTGTHVREYTLPANFQIAATDSGPRGNAVFEGLTITPDRCKTVVIAEGALFQDGAAPTVTTGETSRITVFDRATGVARAQYAYPIERVQATPVPADQFTVNGPTEILAVADDNSPTAASVTDFNQFLVFEVVPQ